jgi:hypothetical protein
MKSGPPGAILREPKIQELYGSCSLGPENLNSVVLFPRNIGTLGHLLYICTLLTVETLVDMHAKFKTLWYDIMIRSWKYVLQTKRILMQRIKNHRGTQYTQCLVSLTNNNPLHRVPGHRTRLRQEVFPVPVHPTHKTFKSPRMHSPVPAPTTLNDPPPQMDWPCKTGENFPPPSSVDGETLTAVQSRPDPHYYGDQNGY